MQGTNALAYHEKSKLTSVKSLEHWPQNIEKIVQILEKVGKKVTESKSANISISKLNLKFKITQNKLVIKPLNNYSEPCFETTYLGENVKQWLNQKEAQNVIISLGFFIFQKSHHGHPKVAQLTKKLPKQVTLFFCHTWVSELIQEWNFLHSRHLKLKTRSYLGQISKRCSLFRAHLSPLGQIGDEDF